MNYNRIIQKIRKYDTVSFDVFDTLIERDVSCPADIFMRTGKWVLGADSAEEFKIKRIHAEEEARKRSVTNEITLDEIYNQLKDYELKERKKLEETELKIELESCSQKQEIYKIFSWACEHVSNVVIISDMYLPYFQLNAILQKCGYDGYRKLYVSNEYGVNKISGLLYDVVVKDLNISKEGMVHLGDSVRADLIGAHKAGIHSILVNRKNRIARKLFYK